ncbi:hypothetical protein GIB67_007512 [Kingdonia uniflora]|uniref:Uncharacterized protein n=1 Tax=Kingdonia uniflora TaxID=39325 RepID=A0A7J7LW67_9MAGN|nr:hypothetical protein GIB67_007512 [Kingdonia uniflora]
MVTESWFSSLWAWKNPPEPEKSNIGVLTFEVASLMSKVVHLWQCLSDNQVVRLREEIMNSEGVRKLVSDDDDFLVELACAEIVENLGLLARSVARLGKKCNDPVLQQFENVFDDLIQNNADLYGLQYALKKMERKVKKMSRFVAVSVNLYQELEVLAELEQTLRRMQVINNPTRTSLLDFKQKVLWQRQEVKNLREISLWSRTYDYTVHLLARSLFTIFGRITHVFGIHQMTSIMGINDSRDLNSDNLRRSHSMQSSVHPSERTLSRFSSGPLGRTTMKSGPISRTITKSGPISGTKVMNKRQPRTPEHSTSRAQHPHSKIKRFAPVGPFKGCMMSGEDSPVLHSFAPVSNGTPRSNGVYSGVLRRAKDSNVDILHSNLPLISSKRKILKTPPSTLGASALALHYANIIIVIEKLVASPHLIGPDARDDLYNMLPTSLRAALRARLKSYAKNLASSVYDTDLAAEWTEALTRILEWLMPLAQNMLRWQSERNFEQQNLVSRTNVLLVQTLYFADQAKIEAAMTELLVGLNYLWRFGRDLSAKALLECRSSRVFDDYLGVHG